MRTYDIFEHQAQSLVGLVRRCEGFNGASPQLEELLKHFVATELLGRGNLDVIARALGELDEAQARRLNDMVNHCSQTFYHSTEIWSAIAVPIAVQWNRAKDAAFALRRADADCVNALAAVIRQCTGAQKVTLDRHLYSAHALFMASAHQMHDHLRQVITKGQRLAPAIKPLEVRSSNEAPWRMVYFLGAEIIDLQSKRRLNEAGVQDAMQCFLHLGEDALTSRDSAMFKRGVVGKTICHPPMYLHDAIQHGEQAMRGYRLRHMIDEISKEEKSIQLFYALDAFSQTYEILLVVKWLAFELRWKLFAGERFEAFVDEIKTQLKASSPSLQCKWIAVDLEEFLARRAATSLAFYPPTRM
jgi:hypothetical protein